MTRVQLLITFGYRGDLFFGLQPQPQLPTAGGALAARLREAAGERPRGLAFAARTDRGVHAEENRATCYFVDPADVAGLLTAVSAPRDDGLRDVRVEVVPVSVHARGSSRGKRYRYTIIDADDDALLAPTTSAWHIAPRLDIDRMRAAARLLEGSHDFSSFRGGGCSAKSPEKTLAMIEVGVSSSPADKRRVITIELVGDAFLRNMVRNIVGYLVEVGAAWRHADDVTRALDARVRQAAGIMAPPGGLTLARVGFAWPPDGQALLPEIPGHLRAADAAGRPADGVPLATAATRRGASAGA